MVNSSGRTRDVSFVIIYAITVTICTHIFKAAYNLLHVCYLTRVRVKRKTNVSSQCKDVRHLDRIYTGIEEYCHMCWKTFS